MKLKKLVPAVIVGAGTAAVLWYTLRPNIPSGAFGVSNFKIENYLGDWFEIARMDYKFEKNLINTKAHYELREDGLIKVINSGYNVNKDEWEEVTGKAKFAGDPDIAELLVSFFGPFYAGYNVIALEEDYKYALVAGRTLDYMWILSREKTIPKHIKKAFLHNAENVGYNISRLTWVKHDEI